MAFHENKPIAIGMVGGGPDSGIGETHRIAMRIGNKCELIAGAFSRSREKSLLAAKELRIASERVYDSYQLMAAAESKREDKIDAVCVVTPTDHHYEVAKTFLQAGIHVICDKPLCVSLNEAKELLKLADKSGLIVCLTHNYTGYAMVRQAAEMVRTGDLGEIKAVHVEHASGWASKLQEDEKKNEPSWRMNPARLGDASLLLDLGTHAHHLARFVTGLDVTQVVGELSTIVPGLPASRACSTTMQKQSFGTETMAAARSTTALTGVYLLPIIIGLVTRAPSQWKKFNISGPLTPGNKYLFPPEKPTTS